jgi:toxin secretion/phage lysis holin
MKETIYAAVIAVYCAFYQLIGGWNSAFGILFLFMFIDIITGWIVAGCYHKSDKSKSGKLESKAVFKGIAKKIMILVMVVVAKMLDILIGWTGLEFELIGTGVILWFIAYELLSIVENAGRMGIPVPPGLTNAIAVFSDLNKKKGVNNGENEPVSSVQKTDK